MDQALRNLLQRTTQAARILLEREFAAQLEGTYDILPDGTIAKKPGPHLDAAGRLVRQKLVEAVEHRIAGGHQAVEAVADYSREAAFTCLNRFVALKMLEARELVQTCVSKGEQSGGFREFCGLAPGLSELPDGGYQLYLESLCDELSVEVKVLFDRREPASLLWPRRQPLTDLLALLNDPELASAWIQDETIGWVYQYFNSKEERQAMRDPKQGGSQAPRNSRELAVRNQFFTPRYVVQFLTDNTLGRIWYEMRQGRTALVEKCQYLVRRPVEVFLKEGEQAPQMPLDEDLSQEELLRQPVHVPFRPKKDPRDLKILDPACGSGHFLLYCFDLLQTIYEEAWEDAGLPSPSGRGAGAEGIGSEGDSLPSPVLGRGAGGEGTLPLRETYPTLDLLRAAVPSLILRHNLHGIDIDPRCAQIAAFALWMRAQRAYNELGLERDQRPPIRKTNVVVAEPMPGEEDMLDEFLRDLREDRLEGLMRRALDIPPDKRVCATKAMADSLCGLVRTAWEKMKLAGEAGSLLKIEEELAAAIAKGREEWEEELPLFRMTEFDLDGRIREQYVKFIPGEGSDFWQKAERLVLASIREFAAQAANGLGFRRRLFAEDASRGFAFVDLCRQRYDILLMNPPFGLSTSSLYDLQTVAYPGAHGDLFASFVRRCSQLCNTGGKFGAITSRAFLVAARMEQFRRNDFVPQVSLLLDLGLDVMDDAWVESCAYVLQPVQSQNTFLAADARRVSEKSSLLLSTIDPRFGSWNVVSRNSFLSLPTAAILYRLPSTAFSAMSSAGRFEPRVGTAREGMRTFDDFRFVRLHWEVNPGFVGPDQIWCRYAKGGEYALFRGDLPLVVLVRFRMRELDAENLKVNGSVAQVRQASTYWFRPGITYSRRSAKGFSARVLPRDHIISDRGPAILAESDISPLYLLGWLNSRLIRSLVHMQASASLFTSGIIKDLPWRTPDDRQLSLVIGHVTQILRTLRRTQGDDETTADFMVPSHRLGVRQLHAHRQEIVAESVKSIKQCMSEIDVTIDEIYLLPSADLAAAILGPQECQTVSSAFVDELSLTDFVKREVSLLVGCAFGRWNIEMFARGSSTCRDDVFEIVPFRDRGVLVDGPEKEYPLDVPLNGILVDDPGNADDLLGRLRNVCAITWPDASDEFSVIAEILGDRGVESQSWFRESFFDCHIIQYSKGHRKAPIYWELATPSHKYAVWLYYHRFTRDTFYKVLNDYVKPKLTHEEQKLARVRAEAGETPTRSQAKELETQEAFVAELTTFREEVERIAPLWNPDLNDGVIINFAPLWRLVPQHKAWQKECKECWDALVAGEYDWAHLAMHLWPERIVPKCRDDRSLAIAHALEDLFWVEDYDKWRALGEPAAEIEDQKQRRRRKQHDQLKAELGALVRSGAGVSPDLPAGPASGCPAAPQLTAAALWTKLAAGDLDDTGAALLLWPARVIGKCVEDSRLAGKLHVNVPERRTKAAVEKLIKRYEDAGCGDLAAAVGAAFGERETLYPQAWKALEAGDLDDQALALALWPDRVVDKCAADMGLAQKHDLARFFWYDDPWTKAWRRRESPDVEVKNEVAQRHKPAVKAALQSLLSAPTPGSAAKGRRRRKA